MAKVARIREVVSTLSPDYLKQKTDAGWKLVAVEWAREDAGEGEERGAEREEVPFGLQVADDCLHLEENFTEKQALMLMMELIVQDHPLSQVAGELNRQGFRTRQGSKWGPESVFKMLPRLVDFGPRLFTSGEWIARRQRPLSVV